MEVPLCRRKDLMTPDMPIHDLYVMRQPSSGRLNQSEAHTVGFRYG